VPAVVPQACTEQTRLCNASTDPVTPALMFHAMLCYAMLCYAMLCYAMLCYAMLCYAMLCYAMLCYAVLRSAYLWTRPGVGPGSLGVLHLQGQHHLTRGEHITGNTAAPLPGMPLGNSSKRHTDSLLHRCGREQTGWTAWRSNSRLAPYRCSCTASAQVSMMVFIKGFPCLHSLLNLCSCVQANLS
jgi:hypothetical protein